MEFCIPPKQAEELKAALLRDGTSPIDLMEMPSSEDRRAFFEKFVSKEDAEQINIGLERTVLLKNQEAGYLRWFNNIKSTIPPRIQRDLLTKITKLDKVMNPADEKAFMADLAKSKLGAAVTYEEAQKITKLAQNASLERDKSVGSTFGATPSFVKAASDLEHYVKSIAPTTALASIGKNVAIIARNHLLMNPATPIKTTEGQIVNSAMDMVTRRIANRSAGGASPELRDQLNTEAWKFFRETGFNPAIMESYEDSGRLGEKARFDVPKGMLSTNPALHAIEATVRGYAQLTNKIAIDIEHNFTFTKFYQKAFFDMANIGATNMAKADGLSGAAMKSRAEAIMRDAAKIAPDTDAGKVIRRESQKQAARVTSTNDTVMANMALGVKDALNKWVLGLGDAMMPIAKIPANIIYNGIENAGVGLPHGAWEIFQGQKKLQSTDEATRHEGLSQFTSGIQRLARTVGVMAAAAFFASMFKKQDFRSDKYGDSYFRIGHTWINTEYLSFMSPALAGAMYVKQYGRSSDHIWKTAEIYSAGALQGLKHAPGVDELSNLVSRVSSGDPFKGLAAYAISRAFPSGIHNLFYDRKPGEFFGDRPGNRLLFGAHGVESQQEVGKDNEEKAQNAAKSRAEHRAL